MFSQPHRRYNPLLGKFVLCSPHRNTRPWLGEKQAPTTRSETSPSHSPTCFLCPGNNRANGIANSEYTTTFTFTNDFSALLPPAEGDRATETIASDNAEDLFRSEEVFGNCKVICFSPNHSESIAEMTVDAIYGVVTVWKEEYNNLSGLQHISYIQIFENKGVAMGCSNPHPHCQIWASSFIPSDPLIEFFHMGQYHLKHEGKHMLEDYINREINISKENNEDTNRLIYTNESFAALVPYWASWPFEVMIIAKTHKASINDFSELGLRDLAEIIRVVTCKYDNLFEISFPYSMGIHQAPSANCDDQTKNNAHFHIHFFPPLLNADRKKFMVGYEMMAEPQRDITPEQAAKILRSIDGTKHYLK